jgi:hypothetical protein
LSFSNLTLLFHCGSADVTKAIIAKLETSKAAAGEALEMVEASRHVTSDGEDDYDTPAAEPKAVRWAEPAPSAGSSGESGKILYDFEAQGDDELTVTENDTVTVVDKENDEWWLVRNSAGKEGVVPAQYIEIGASASHDAYDSDDEAQKQEDEAAAAAAVEAERQREQQRKAEQRRAIEKAAREKQAQEDHDRRLAEAIEAEEAEKRAMSAARRDEQVRQEREINAGKKREAARRMEPPKISKRPSAQNVAAAAANLPTRGHAAPARPPDNDRPSELTCVNYFGRATDNRTQPFPNTCVERQNWSIQGGSRVSWSQGQKDPPAQAQWCHNRGSNRKDVGRGRSARAPSREPQESCHRHPG